jgi:AraC-like DNA-binding protein
LIEPMRSVQISLENAMSHRSFELRTTDVDNVRQVVAGLFCPFRLTADSASYDARLRHDALGGLSFTTLAYGNDVEIDVDERLSRFLVQIPLAGAFEARTRGPAYRATSTTAQLVPPKTPIHMRCSADCTILVVTADPRDLEFQTRTLTGEDVDLATVVPDTVPLSGSGSTLRHYIDFLHAEARRSDSLLRYEPARPATQALLAMLVQSFNIRERARPAGRAWYVKRAEAFMEENLACPIGICDVVASAGVSMRTLYHGFRSRHGVAPMTWLKRRRLARVHDELLRADPAQANVTDVATRWGFFHLGRFASDYRARFGELPSRTLGRR